MSLHKTNVGTLPKGVPPSVFEFFLQFLAELDTLESFETNYLEAMRFCNYIDATDSLTGRLAISVISSLFVDRFGRSCHLAFDIRKPFLMSFTDDLPLFCLDKRV